MISELLGTLPHWTNSELYVYHGTDDESAKSIKERIDLSRGRVAREFGQGFYTTTSPAQAHSWAAQRALSKKRAPYVVRFSVNREALAALHTLWFIRGTPDSEDFWSFVAFCRDGGVAHGREAASCYDIVAGPVTSSSQFGREIIPGYDQISFHTEAALRALQVQT